MTHTPGPWRYEDGAFLSPTDPVFYIAMDAPGKVCVTPEDARLIAAAPALLEALEAVEVWYGSDLPPNIIGPKIRAAIALAKGENK